MRQPPGPDTPSDTGFETRHRQQFEHDLSVERVENLISGENTVWLATRQPQEASDSVAN